MHILPRTLSIITTHQCTAACDHCCFNCTPKVTAAIPIERIRSLIQETKAIPTIGLIVFTGGECFLLGDSLDEFIAQARELGHKTRCVTNGYWATKRNASTRVDKLKRAGLNEINFSTGSKHGEFVPTENIVRGAIACAESGIISLINIETFLESTFDVEEVTENKTIKELVDSRRLIIQRNVWIKGDGESTLTHCNEHSRFKEDRLSGCTTALNVLAVTPSQKLVACCGLHLERIPELHLGSIQDRTLKEVIDSADDDFLKIWIHVDGPERILNFVKSHDVSYFLPLSSTHPCETCLHLYKDPRVHEVIRENYHSQEERVVSLYLSNLTSTTLSRQIANTLTAAD